jgi:hypothetical protein
MIVGNRLSFDRGAHETARVSRWAQHILPCCCSMAISARKGIILPHRSCKPTTLCINATWQRAAATALWRMSALRSLPGQLSMRYLMRIVAARQRRAFGRFKADLYDITA